MKFYIKEARERAGLSQKELAQIIGVAPNTMHGYESGKHDPKSDLLTKIAMACHVSVDFLLGQSQTEKKTDQFGLEGARERTLVKKYRALDEYGKKAVDAILNVEYQRQEETLARQQAEEDAATLEYDLPGPQENLIEIRFYPQRVSAGYGEWLDEMDSYTIQVPDTPTTRRADFCLKVEGDSMEPKYSDGDLVFVKKQDDVRVGEFGVWIVDGYAYLKKRGVDTLISINPNYDDIEQGEDVRCVGKVIGKM